MKSENFKKSLVSFRYWLYGKAEENKEYYRVLEALEIAQKYHKGKRKDGDHEFTHQLTICLYLRTLHLYFRDPVVVFIVALFHDTLEDYFEESHAEIADKFPNEYDMIMRISKIRGRGKIPYEQYFGEMTDCFVCSIVKPVDRIANISTMIGVFSEEKQLEYIEEVKAWFLPMIKAARRMFPDQEAAYENIKSFLLMQINTILAVRAELAVQ